MKPILPKGTSTVKFLEEPKPFQRIVAPPGVTLLLIPSSFSKSNLIISNIKLGSSNPEVVVKNCKEIKKIKRDLHKQRGISSKKYETVSDASKIVSNEVEKFLKSNDEEADSKELSPAVNSNKSCNIEIEVQNVNKTCQRHEQISHNENQSNSVYILNTNTKHDGMLYENNSRDLANKRINYKSCVPVSPENVKIDVCISSPPSYESHVSNSSKVLVQIEENRKITNEFLTENIPTPPSYHQTSHGNESLYVPPNSVSSSNHEAEILYPQDPYQYDSLPLDSHHSNSVSSNFSHITYQSSSLVNKSTATESRLKSVESYNDKRNKIDHLKAYDENAWSYSSIEDQPRDYSYNSVLSASQKLEKEKAKLIDPFIGNALSQVIFNPVNEKSYEERRNIAKNLLSIPGNKTDRKKAFQENFWIVEDEPLEESIFFKSATEQNDLLSTQKLNLPKSRPSRNYICHICGKKLKGLTSLKPHINLHLNIKPYECKYCQKKFTQSSVMKNHVRIHTGETPYSCRTCGKSFKTLSILRRHSSQHSQTRPFSCCVCSKSFKSKVDLQCHLKIHLSGPHTCTYCKTLYESRKSLATHIQRKHKNQMDYMCTICNKAYGSQGYLQQHMNVHSNKPKYSCHVCSAAYTWRSGLASHMKTHSFKIQCEICGVRFTSLKKHEKHRSRHSEPFPYKCSKCDKQFKYNSLLKKHISKHKDELSCQACGINFIYKTQMKKHMKTHSHKQSNQ